MRRLLLALLVVSSSCPLVVAAAPDGVPARPMCLGNWYHHDPVKPTGDNEAWTSSDVVGFLARYPGAYLELGRDAGKPPGNLRWLATARAVSEVRSIAEQRGIDVKSRLCVDERPDVMTRNRVNVLPCAPSRGGGGCDWEGDMDGRHGEAETVLKTSGHASDGNITALTDARANWPIDLYVHRRIVLRPGAADEETRRVASNDPKMLVVDAPWTVPPAPGDTYQIFGTFDPAWAMRIPIATHAATVERFWTGARNVCEGGQCAPPAEPLDPFVALRGFEPWADREAILALRTPSTVPGLWGYTYDADPDPRTLRDPYYAGNSVIMDLRNRAYRVWRARLMLYRLEDSGFAKSDSVCMTIGTKPGIHTYHDPAHGVNPHPCAVPDTHNWYGPAHVCTDGYFYNGPFEPTQYGPGEFEAGISAYYRELVATLSANGWRDVRIVSEEAPQYIRPWSTIASDVRALPAMYGEKGGYIEPRLAELAEPSDPEPPADPTANAGTDADPPSTPTQAPAPPAATAPPAGTASSAGGESAASSGGSAGATSAPAASDTDAPRRGEVMRSNGGGGGTIEPPVEP
jgi:hypothetical protein